MPQTHETRLALLQAAYSRVRGKSVAFIDESYVLADFATSGRTFYIATAYIAPEPDHETIRSDLHSIVGGNYWHTSETHQDQALRPRITKMCEYIGEGGPSEAILFVIKRPIDAADHGGEQARNECLTQLLSNLASGAHTDRVQLSLLEERRHMKQRNIDEATIKSARGAGLLGGMQTLFTSPSAEPLLWVPDVVSFAQNHRERKGSVKSWKQRGR